MMIPVGTNVFHIYVHYSHFFPQEENVHWLLLINKQKTNIQTHYQLRRKKKKSLRYGLALSTVYKYILFGYKMVLSKLTA